MHSEDEGQGYVAVGTPVKVGSVDDLETKALLYNFESVGFNCEFGLVQRRYGAEPTSLLRWTTTYPDVLINLLKNNFTGVGNIHQTRLHRANWGELIVFDLKYQFKIHTFIMADSVPDQDKFLLEQCSRATHLAQKLCRNLAAGEKILVYHAPELNADLELNDLVRSYGKTPLMIVRVADDAHASGTVVDRGNGMFEAYISRAGATPRPGGGGTWNIDFDAWIKICGSCLAMTEGLARTADH